MLYLDFCSPLPCSYSALMESDRTNILTKACFLQVIFYINHTLPPWVLISIAPRLVGLYSWFWMCHLFGHHISSKSIKWHFSGLTFSVDLLPSVHRGRNSSARCFQGAETDSLIRPDSECRRQPWTAFITWPWHGRKWHVHVQFVS